VFCTTGTSLNEKVTDPAKKHFGWRSAFGAELFLEPVMVGLYLLPGMLWEEGETPASQEGSAGITVSASF